MSNKSKGPNPSEPHSVFGSPKPSPYWGLGANEFYRSLANKTIKITALDGKLYNGTLVGVDQYDLFVRQANGFTILFAKHGLKFVHADASNANTSKEKTE